MPVTLFIGSTNRRMDGLVQGAGLAMLRFDEDALDFTLLSVFDAIDNPTFLAFDTVGSRLFAVAEVPALFENLVVGFDYNAGSGELNYINAQPTLGTSTCHVSVLADGRIATTNYDLGRQGPRQSVALYRTGPTGRLSPPEASVRHVGTTGPRADRQEAPHCHSANPTPDGNLLIVCDLGTDEVIAYRLEGDLAPAFTYRATPGAGPRHSAISADGRFVYVANELNASVTALALGAEGFARLDELTLLREGETRQCWAAELRLSPDGRHLYVSNRVADTLSVFAVAQNGRLTPVEIVSSGGAWPRNFDLTPSGQFLLVANQNSNTIAVFRRDADTGRLSDTGARFAIEAPMRILAV